MKTPPRPTPPTVPPANRVFPKRSFYPHRAIGRPVLSIKRAARHGVARHGEVMREKHWQCFRDLPGLSTPATDDDGPEPGSFVVLLRGSLSAGAIPASLQVGFTG